jgi:pimeloyl-ACP methyl ester carboxylesterase
MVSFLGRTRLLNINENWLNVYYSDWSGGRKAIPKVFLLHGSMAHWLDWKYQIASIEDCANVIAIDMRGHGMSDFGCGFDVDILLQDILGVINALGVEKCIIGGHSFGGMLAQIFAHRFPEKTEGLILVDSSSHYEPKWDDRLVAVLPEVITKKLLFSDNPIARFIAKSMFFSPKTSKELINEYLDDHIHSIARYSPKVFKGYKCLWGFNSTKWLGDISAPALVTS